MLVLKLGQKTKVGNNPVHNELSVYTAIVKQPLVPRVSQNPKPVVKLKSSMNSKNWKTPQPMSTLNRSAAAAGTLPLGRSRAAEGSRSTRPDGSPTSSPTSSASSTSTTTSTATAPRWGMILDQLRDRFVIDPLSLRAETDPTS